MDGSRDGEIKAMVAADIANGAPSTYIRICPGEDCRAVGMVAVEAARANGVDADWGAAVTANGPACGVYYLERFR